MENEEKWKEFDKAVLEGRATWWQMELPSGNVFFGDAKTDMLGYKAEDFKKYQDFTSLLHPDDYENAIQDMKNHLEGKKDYYETIYRIKRNDGEYIRFYDCGKVVDKTDGKTTTIGFVLKLDNAENEEEQKEKFKKMVVEDKPSLVDVITEMKRASYSF